jgi:hypothetical protein
LIQQFDWAIRFGNLIWQLDSATRFGNSIRQFNLAFRQFDLAIRYGKTDSIWHFANSSRMSIRQFNSIWQFDTKIGAPEFWQELRPGKQLWMQQLWWRARNLML